ncbi:hypothetical protein AMK59_3059 [Oryctes borbonicus]|uniref:Centrosomal protein CEP104 Zn finger domain-containing protein n=1 Tax=Oryctes borbonicus TaxID=1629725 RepID=A0A0T6B6M1_9SCAR|nr:hypothetical protein AMK59_3059 [Oryctes borbonicus]
MLDRNRVIQNAISANPECISPEPNHNIKNGINKCQSSSNIPHLATNNCDQNEAITGSNKNYTLTKSISGNNIGINGQKKTENENSTSSASGISSPSNNSQKEDEEKHCLFCQQSEATILSVSNSMNSHYWRSCPMLVRCKACSQVVEVSALIEHLLMECEQREQYTQCSQCTEAVKLDEYECHSDKCTELTEGCNRCPLCHANIEDEENSWKIHLMGEKACTKNNRVKNLQKQVKIKT